MIFQEVCAAFDGCADDERSMLANNNPHHRVAALLSINITVTKSYGPYRAYNS